MKPSDLLNPNIISFKVNFTFRSILIILFVSVLFLDNIIAQDPHRFDNEINKFSEITISSNENVVVFTGSSSIRLWADLKMDCQHMPLINTGFGGSHMSDLLYFLDQTILRFKPSKVYIYEGDNDISAGKNPLNVLATTKEVVDKILDVNPNTEIHFIAAKPSPSRWHFKSQYESFNGLLKKYCESHPQLYYIDIWSIMLNKHGRPNPDIFISDSLHMNRQGYLLWKTVICR